jgi:hypothetical protein
VEEADDRAPSFPGDSRYVLTFAFAAQEPEKPQQANSGGEQARREDKDDEQSTPDARRDARRNH